MAAFKEFPFPFGFRLKPERQVPQELRGPYDAAAGFYRVWHTAEGSRRSIIDFDLTKPSAYFDAMQTVLIRPPTKAERGALLQKLGEQISKMEGVKPPPEERHNYEFLLAKLTASQAYLRRLAGEPVNFSEYIKTTMGIEPQEIREDILLAQKQKVMGLFEEAGGTSYDGPSLQAFNKEKNITPEEMVEGIKRYGDRALFLVGKFLSREIKIAYRTELVKEDAYWFNWADGAPDNFRFRVNQHSRHQGKFTDGKAWEMACHEIAAHFGMMQQRAELVRKGGLPEVFGLTTVHDPEQVLMEGIAQTLHYFVPELNRSLTPEGRFRIEFYGLRQMVYNNVHLMVNSPEFADSPRERETIIVYVQSFCPTENPKNIIKEIEDRRYNPKWQAYRYAYGAGFLLHQQFAQGLNPEGRREFLGRVYDRPFTPTQEEKLYRELWSNPRYRQRDNGEDGTDGPFLNLGSPSNKTTLFAS